MAPSSAEFAARTEKLNMRVSGKRSFGKSGRRRYFNDLWREDGKDHDGRPSGNWISRGDSGQFHDAVLDLDGDFSFARFAGRNGQVDRARQSD